MPKPVSSTDSAGMNVIALSSAAYTLCNLEHIRNVPRGGLVCSPLNKDTLSLGKPSIVELHIIHLYISLMSLSDKSYVCSVRNGLL